jgi:glycosyltransferase involved in cell wall biosynthesis
MKDEDGPLVSVCIPAYNAERTIGETIRSVLDSAYTNLEVIVSDDASTDCTRKVVEGFGDPRVRFYSNEQTAGPGGNWNRALQKAHGKYAGLLNHDDLYGPFWLTFAVHALETRPHIGWVTTAFRVVDDEGRTLAYRSRFAATGEIERTEAFWSLGMEDGLLPAYLARREILEAVSYYDETFGASADKDLYVRLAARHPLYYSATPHAAWRLHADNLSHQYGHIEQNTAFYKVLRKAFGDPSLPEELRRTREACYARSYARALRLHDQLLQDDDLDAAQEIMMILRQNGYGEG